MQENSNYYSIIPMQVLLDKNISANAKLVYAELSSLDSKAGFAWCSNKYLADIFGVSIATIKRNLQELIKNNYIKCEYETDNARKIFLNKALILTSQGSFKNEPTSVQKCTDPRFKNEPTLVQKCTDPRFKNEPQESIDEKVYLESIDENIEDVSKDTSMSSQCDDEPIKRPTMKDINRVIALFKNICVSYPKPKNSPPVSSDVYKFTNARLKEYSINEIKKAFENAENSNFMKGQNEKGWEASFTWIMRVNNFPKVFENKYKNNQKLEEYKELKKQKDLAFIKNAEKQIDQQKSTQQKNKENLNAMEKALERMAEKYEQETNNKYIGENETDSSNISNSRDY